MYSTCGYREELSPAPAACETPSDNTALCRLTSVTEELATATETVSTRQATVMQLQQELQVEEQSTHPRQR